MIAAIVVGVRAGEKSTNNDYQSQQEESFSPSPVTEQTPMTTFRYVLTVSIRPLSDSTSVVRLSAVKLTLQDGLVTTTEKFANQYLFNDFFASVAKHVDAARRIAPQP